MKARGFTMLELLVAIAIFAIMSAIAYGGYNNSVRQSALARASDRRLTEVQTAIRLLTSDFEQLAPRPVRDIMGGPVEQSALIALNDGGETIVTLTRSGWTNPMGLPRSTQERVSYALVDKTLRRDHLTVLDATPANELVQRKLLSGVKSLQLRFMSLRNRQWQTQWPPGGGSGISARSRPLAVEIKLDLEDYGEITRLVEVGG